MSQVKASPTGAQTQFALQQQHPNDQEQFSHTTSGPVHRIMTRRASRSAQSHSTIPVIVKTPAEPGNNKNHINTNTDNNNEEKEDVPNHSNGNNDNNNDNGDDVSMDPATPTPTDNTNSRMTTRSRSIDLNQSNNNNNNNNTTYGISSAEESSNTSSTSQITTKRRKNISKGKTKTKTKNRKRGAKASSTSSLSPPITTTIKQRRQGEELLRGNRRRNAKDNSHNNGAETTQLDAVKLKKLAELDELEKTILDGTHDEYRERMAHAEKKRLNEMKNAKLRRDLEEADIRFTFEAFKKAAYDHFYQCKAEIRKRMINQVQAQIKRSEEEWHAPSHENTGCSDDDQELYDWVPHRHTSIYFEPLGLKQEEILDDITAARSKLYITESNN